MKDTDLHIIEKPEWVSWDEIHDVLWKAHAENREKGMNMNLPALPAEQIRGYGQAERTQQLAAGTQLHLIVMQIRGWRMERMEEVSTQSVIWH